MSFSQIKFFGATVKSVTSSLGWGNQKSTCTIGLVEDTLDGDFFLPPIPGTPAFFFIEKFNFYGLMQKWVRKQDINGKPTFEVVLEDPRDILENCELILEGYSGSVAGVPNLLNVYGYWESTGFGNANVNEGGMPWYLIKNAAVNLTSGLAPAFGNFLIHKGNIPYTIDLSELPIPPNYYRIGGGHATLFDAISRICDDGACDFFIELVPAGIPRIKVRTASRRFQHGLGTLTQLITEHTNSGICVASQNGLEATNNASSAFVVGANKTSIYEANPLVVQPFWGFDFFGLPITGVGTDYDHTMLLNALEISDILGSAVYPCTVLELLCALTDNNMWQDYLWHNKNSLALSLGMIAPHDVDLPPNKIKKPKDIVNTKQTVAFQAGLACSTSTIDHMIERLYSFIRKYASEYLGKKFVVQIPFVLTHVDGESGKITYSNEVTDSGYASELAPPLGLNPIYQIQFQSQDSRFNPYAVFTNVQGANFERLCGEEFVIDGSAMYTKCSVDPKIYYLYGIQPCVVVTLNNAIYKSPADSTGAGIDILDRIFAGRLTEPVITRLLKERGVDTLGLFVSPLPYQPTSVAVPMRSNTDVYGPWYAPGAPGRVQFSADSSLAPWNYGGFQYMNLAGNARVIEAATFQQFSETGRLELAGAPTHTLGDVMQANGPNITNIEIFYGTSGVTTNYAFSTFTQKIGTFSKQNSDRFRRIGHGMQDLKREVRQNLNRILQPNQQAIQGSLAESYIFARDNWFPKQARGQSPHSLLFAKNTIIESGKVRSEASTMENLEFIRSINSNDDVLFITQGGMSISGLLRPFTTLERDYYSERARELPAYTVINENFTNGITRESYDPFQQHNDIEWYLYGDFYEDCKAYQLGGPINTDDTDMSNVRPLALRGPLLITGWGWSTKNKPVPRDSDEDDEYTEDYLLKSNLWPTGPVDLLWDEEKGVWTSHDLKMGKMKERIGAGEKRKMFIYQGIDDNTEVELDVSNFYSRAIPENTKVMVGWMSDASEWYIVSADCP